MADTLKEWLEEQSGSVFCVRWPNENFISGLVLEPAKNGPFAFYWSNFEGKNIAKYSISKTKTFEIEFPSTLTVSRLHLVSNLSHSKEQHIKLVEEAIRSINKGVAEKIVVARKEEYTIEKWDSQATFIRLSKKYPAATVYWFLNKEHQQEWMGATPELLLRASEQSFETVSLAGTRPVKTQADWGKKEIREQQVVTDYIVSKLQQLQFSSINTTTPITYEAGPVEHLKSDITALVNTKTNLLEVAQQLHPTPAVSGLPRAAALQFLADKEPLERTAYAGFFGLENKSNQSGVFYVNLRCMRIKGDILTLYAGGGINSESNAADEWEETVAKLSTLKSVF